MNIVFASHSPFDPSLVVGSHHLARQCARLGHLVLHLSTPVTVAHLTKLSDARIRSRMRKCWRGPEQIETGLYEWIPLTLTPWQLARRGNISKSNRFVPSRRSLLRCLESLKMPGVDMLFIDEPRLVGIESVLKPSRLAYRATDLYAEMKRDPSILEAERILCERSGLRIGTSRPVAEHLERLANRPVVVLENGVEVDHLQRPTAAHRTLTGVGVPRAVYVGAVDDRFDWELTMQLAASRPAVQFLIYGPVTLAVPTNRPANLLLMGSLAYSEMPSVLQHCQVGLLPLNDHPANSARSPMKFYEYAAAGLPILARATPEIVGRTEIPAATYADTNGALAALDQLLIAERITFDVEPHSWAGKAKFLLSQMENSVS